MTGLVRHASLAEAADAVEILREAAAWTARFGAPIWDAAIFTVDAWRAHAEAGELAGGFDDGGRMAACMLLQRADALYWPEDAPGDALYLHKVAVRRDCAGAGWPARLVAWAGERAREAGIARLRLDTMAHGALPALYARLGFHLVDPGPIEVGGRTVVRMERRA